MLVAAVTPLAIDQGNIAQGTTVTIPAWINMFEGELPVLPLHYLWMGICMLLNVPLWQRWPTNGFTFRIKQRREMAMTISLIFCM